MRLMPMICLKTSFFASRPSLLLAGALLLALPAARAHAQAAVPPGQGDTFRDTSILKLPADATKGVAILEFEDLECPACSHAFPVVHSAVEKYQIPYIRHDFPLQMHIWSRDAAVTARYLQDKVSPSVAEQYRRDVFANQASIASKDDLANFTRKWFGTHGQQLPFVVDPSGRFAAEVQADYTLGERLGLSHTPTIFVLSQRGWTQVVDVTQLYTTIDRALADAKTAPKPAAATSKLRKPTTPQK